VLGQYEGYRNEKNVSPDSRVETFAAVKFFVDNWRWKGVPFYVRAGKNLEKSLTEIVVSFKCPPQNFFSNGDGCSYTANQVIMQIQPEETIALRFGAKRPGEDVVTDPVFMKFDYRDAYPGEGMTPYRRLLLDAMAGDRMNFIRQDSVEHSWAVIDAIREAVDGRRPEPYPAAFKRAGVSRPYLWLRVQPDCSTIDGLYHSCRQFRPFSPFNGCCQRRFPFPRRKE